MLKPFDLYTALFSTQRGILTGNYANNGIILYGRVNEKIVPIPNILLSKYQDVIENNNYSVYAFDIFAYQDLDTVYAADGRIAVLLSSDFSQHSITCLTTKLYYLRGGAAGLSVENNMVLGCFFEHTETGFTLRPASLVPAESMSIADEDKKIFIDNLVIPCEFKSAMFPFPMRLGTECPVLANRSSALPAFYTMQNDSLTFIRSLSQLRNMLSDVHMAENYSDWKLTSDLKHYLGSSMNNSQGQPAKVYFEPKPAPEILGVVRQALTIAEDRLSEELNLLGQQEVEDAMTNALCERVLNYISNSYTVTNLGKTGKARFKQMLKVMLKNTGSVLRGAEDDIDALINPLSFQDVRETLYNEHATVTIRSLADWVAEQHITNIKLHTIFAYVWCSLGIRSDYSSIFKLNNPNTALELLLRNPYRLTIVCPDLTISDLDKLACFVGVAANLANLPYRAIACAHSAIVSNEDGNIIYKKDRLRFSIGYTLNKSEADIYHQCGCFLNENQIALARILQPVVSAELPGGLTEVSAYNGGIILNFENIEKEWVLQQYIHSGLGVAFTFRGNQYIMAYEHAVMFCYVCDYFVASQTEAQAVDLDSDDFKSLVERFENSKGFTLEDAQKDVAKLLAYSHGSLVGPAGSGKTTSLELLIRLLEAQEPGIRISLAAPTGMAARRMSECTGRTAKTLHSLLTIGDDSFPYCGEVKALDTDVFDADVLIIDECSMLSLNLLYYVLNRVSKVAPRIFFIGDISQLPPIDCGKPFMDLLHFLPCVRLSVSKRAAAGSAITRNSDILNSGDIQGITSGKDMQLLRSEDESQFSEICASIVNYYLGNTQTFPYGISPISVSESILPSDIQVISPVTKMSYPWSTANLNVMLQDIFNPRARGQRAVVYSDFNRNAVEIRVGDRVINTRNNHSKYRYRFMDADRTQLEAFDIGVVNGDIGTVVSIEYGDTFEWWTSIKVSYSGAHNIELTQDATVTRAWRDRAYNSRKVCMLVEYKDSTGSPYLVAYSATTQQRLSGQTQVMAGTDMAYLSLAYAITSHKMQGSQAKIVIAPLYKCKAKGFISRNLVYTTWTRAQLGLYVIGDLANNGASALCTAKNINALNQRVTPFDIERTA